MTWKKAITTTQKIIQNANSLKTILGVKKYWQRRGSNPNPRRTEDFDHLATTPVPLLHFILDFVLATDIN